MLDRLRRLVQTPHANLVVGLALFGSSSVEVVETMESATVGAHHGVALFGLMQIIKACSELSHGAHGVHKAHRAIADLKHK